MSNLKISIIGAGSVGLLYGYYLADNHEITYYVRNKDQMKELKKLGVTIKGTSINKFVKIEQIENYQKSDLMIIALKQPDLMRLLKIKPFLFKLQPVLFMQNGLSHLEYIEKLNIDAIVATVEHGSYKVNHHMVSHLGKGVTKIAIYSKKTRQLEEIIDNLKHESLNFIYYQNWKDISYEKLVINSVINPLTALFDVPNGDLLENKELRKLSKLLCWESSIILNSDFQSQWENIKRVCTQTSKNTSSMRADIINQRETEIEAIVGYLIKQTDYNAPHLNFVYTSIKALEKRGSKHE